MESNGLGELRTRKTCVYVACCILALRIHVSSDTHAILSPNPDFNFELRGEVEMKGKGEACVSARAYFQTV